MRLTRQQAIDANCRDCNHDPLDVGTWRDQIERCTSLDCPFYEYRPVTTKTLKLRQEAKIKAMTSEERAKHRVKQEAARIRLSTGKKPAIKRIRRIVVSDAPKSGQIMEKLK